MSITIDGTTGIAGVDGSASTPAIQGNDTNTGIAFPAADTVTVATGGTERMRVDSSGNVGIGTSSPQQKLDSVSTASSLTYPLALSNLTNAATDVGAGIDFRLTTGSASRGYIACRWTSNSSSDGTYLSFAPNDGSTGNVERMRITSGGRVFIGKTADDDSDGIVFTQSGQGYFVRDSGVPLAINRLTNDGELVVFYQATTQEGSISVSGTTVSYNGGHLSRWAQTTNPKDETLVKGTVLSNLDEMNVYVDADGNPIDNEQLNKVKVSDVEGDVNVAGVFVNWSYDEAHSVDEINMAMTGDMIIRIAQGVTVQRGDLLMSAGDGTAKPQEDDIVRSKTVAKVTSTHVTCTYEDGSYCVPCVLMAC